MRKFVRMTVPFVSGVMLLILGSSIVCWASSIPEIDPSSGMSALALLAGAMLVIRARRNS
jgi:hypothetical protein